MISATVDELAQIIRRVDGNHSLGAGALAEAILANLPQRAAFDDLADLEAKALAAKKGDWRRDDPPYSHNITVAGPRAPAWICGVRDAVNAAYIVAAQPSVVLKLIERIRAAEAKAGEPVGWVRCDLPAAVKQHRGVSDYISDERVHDDDVALYAAPVDTAALTERVKTLEEALGKLGDHYRNYGSSDEDDILLEIVEVALGGSNE